MAVGVGGLAFLQMCDGNLFIVVAISLRVLQGVGAAIAETAAFDCITRHFGSAMGTMIGICETANGIGTMVGPPIGGLLFEWGASAALFVACDLRLTPS